MVLFFFAQKVIFLMKRHWSLVSVSKYLAHLLMKTATRRITCTYKSNWFTLNSKIWTPPIRALPSLKMTKTSSKYQLLSMSMTSIPQRKSNDRTHSFWINECLSKSNKTIPCYGFKSAPICRSVFLLIWHTIQHQSTNRWALFMRRSFYWACILWLFGKWFIARSPQWLLPHCPLPFWLWWTSGQQCRSSCHGLMLKRYSFCSVWWFWWLFYRKRAFLII